MPEERDAFDYQAPTAASVEHIMNVRSTLRYARNVLLQHVPPSRERSLAITKLEEVSMWANKGIVFNQ